MCVYTLNYGVWLILVHATFICKIYVYIYIYIIYKVTNGSVTGTQWREGNCCSTHDLSRFLPELKKEGGL